MIFIDTSFFFASLSEDDVNHRRVVEVVEGLQAQRVSDLLVTTDHVVFETITLVRYRISHQRAVFVGERLYAEHRLGSTGRASRSSVTPSGTSRGMPTRTTARSTA